MFPHFPHSNHSQVCGVHPTYCLRPCANLVELATIPNFHQEFSNIPSIWGQFQSLPCIITATSCKLSHLDFHVTLHGLLVYSQPLHRRGKRPFSPYCQCGCICSRYLPEEGSRIEMPPINVSRDAA